MIVNSRGGIVVGAFYFFLLGVVVIGFTAVGWRRHEWKTIAAAKMEPVLAACHVIVVAVVVHPGVLVC